MAPNRKPSRPAGPPGGSTTITEIARRYAACGQALARVFGLPFTEAFVKDFHEAIACVFIEAGRCDLRLPARVTLPPLGIAPTADGPGVCPSDATAQPQAGSGPAGEEAAALHTPTPASPGFDASSTPAVKNANGDGPPLPTTIPADGDLPCAGQEIGTLKPAALAMLISKTATLAHVDGAGWAPLLHALQAERQRRVEHGQRQPTPRLVAEKEAEEG